MLSLQSVQPNVVMFSPVAVIHRAVPVNNPVCFVIITGGVCVCVERGGGSLSSLSSPLYL